MDKQPKISALDDYFGSMLKVPIAETQNVVNILEPEAVDMVLSTQDVVAENTHVYVQEKRAKEPMKEGEIVDFFDLDIIDSPLQDLDQLLETVVDIDIDDLELLDIDMTDLTEELTHSQDIQHEVDNAIDKLISAEQSEVVHGTIVETDNVQPKIEQIVETAIAVSTEELSIIPPQPPEWKNIELENEFQALFFEVAGVTFAVPLTELGGIYQTDNINALFGKPDWFLGMMQHREAKFSVVDTVKWVMPEQDLGEIDYKYQIRLSESHWVLGSEVLLGNETLTQSDIKWRTTAGTRPWLAGMVKSRMCVLLHVTEMIKLLDNGMNIQGQ